MDNVKKRVRKFREDREWKEFHTPCNLAKAISIESGELLEHFLWNDNDFDKKEVSYELADVVIYCIHMADSLGVDLEGIINEKMDINEKKYPVSKSKGNSKKYTEFED